MGSGSNARRETPSSGWKSRSGRWLIRARNIIYAPFLHRPIMPKALDDFKAFILKGDVVSMAVGIVIGLAFQAVVTALVADLITPLIGVAGHFDFSSWTFTLHGSTFLQGAFLNAVISFLLISLVVFFVVVRPYEELKKRTTKAAPPPEVTTRDCPYCFTSISNKASRCPNCTSEVTPTAPGFAGSKPSN